MSKMPPLEVMLRHVETNNSWESPDKIMEIKESVIRRFAAYYTVTSTNCKLAGIERRYGISRITLKGWRTGTPPRFAEAYRKSLLPISDEERINFSYVLGVFARNRKETIGEQEIVLGRSIKDPEARKRVKEALEEIIGYEPKEKGTSIRAYNQRLVRTLNYCFAHKIDEYVQTREEKIAFLQGLFDTSSVHIHQVGKRVGYTVRCKNVLVFRYVIRFLFELDILPRINRKNHTIKFSSNRDLALFQELRIDRNEQSRLELADFLSKNTKRAYPVKMYYDVRKRVRELYRNGEKEFWERTTKEFGIKVSGTLRGWVADIEEEEEGSSIFHKRVPERVKSYLEIVKLVGPFRNEKGVVFPFEGELYYLPGKAELEYCEEIGEDELLREDLLFIYDELKRHLNGSNERELEIRIEGKVIREVTAA